MRILLISHYALPHLGGVEIVVDALARRFAGRGHDVTHLAPDSTRPGENWSPTTAYEVVRISAWNGLEQCGYPFPVPTLQARREIRRRVSEADVVHAHGKLFLTSTFALRAAKRQHHPCRILTEHGGPIAPTPTVMERVEVAADQTLGRMTARAANAIVVVNPATASVMQRLAPHTNVTHIANGIDCTAFRPPAGEEKARLRASLGWDARPRLLYVGRVMRRKGTHIAIDAASRANAGELELIVAGSGDVGLTSPNVKMLGPLPAERVAELYRAADMFILPSVREGFPVTLQEAMASGLPSVISDITIAKQLSAAGDRSSTYAAAGADVLLSTIRALLRDREAMRERGRIGAEFARTHFSWDVAVDRYLALYDLVRSRAALQSDHH